MAPQDRNLALALGGLTEGVSPMQMTAAFVPFANGGAYFTPSPILRVINRDGDVLLISNLTKPGFVPAAELI